MVEPGAFYGRAGLNVETYDARVAQDIASAGLEGDVDFYVTRARRTGGPVLELGGGTGRVAWALAQAGFEVVLLDLSATMLAEAERKRPASPPEARQRVRMVEADMADFDLGETFGLAICPFRSFQTLLTPDEQRSCLDTTHRHLRPGGLLIVDLFDPRLDLCLPGVTTPPDSHRATVRHPATGNEGEVRALSRANDALRQVLEERWQFTERDARGIVVRQEEEMLRLRWTYRYEMRHLLELSGFEVEAEFGDFRGSPPAYGHEQVWVARR